MKIGITTFQYAYNYGAILQLVAMQRIIKSLGHQAEAINYLPDTAKDLPFWRGWGIRQGDLVDNIRKRLIRFRYGKSTKSKFNDFKKEYLNISNPCYSEQEVARLVSKYDAVLTGSDQVWHFNNSPVYFLEWGEEFEGIRISYAPSCGLENQPVSKFNEVKKWIGNIEFLSVRDEASKKVIQKVSGRNPEIVADPTLLVDLMDMSSPLSDIPNKYIFMYVLGDEISGGHKKMIQHIRTHYGKLPVVALVASAHKPQVFSWADHTIYNAGPAEWLYLIKNSSFVYTDSFHCSLFAVKNEKGFLAYYSEPRRAPRLVDICDRYGLSQSIAGSVEEAVTNEFWKQETGPIILNNISKHVEMSLAFLTNALKNQ